MPLSTPAAEVIEAHYLFGLDYDSIEAVIHRQSIIHSLVEFQDSSMLAQLGWPDMRLPLLYSITWPAPRERRTETFRHHCGRRPDIREIDFENIPIWPSPIPQVGRQEP